MLSKLRNFSKSKPAILLIAIIIIPFVFWGMGSVFSGGNTNNIAKINNRNISTQDFLEYINSSKINPESLRNNIDNNVLEEILTQYISLSILDMEVDELEVHISDKILINKIKKNKIFFDESGKFSRLKYEKFLLENNVSASQHESNIKDSELQYDLFNYVSGGIKSPEFLVKNFYIEETKEIEIEYINLENLYKKEFSLDEVNEYLKKNEDDFTRDVIDIVYSKITPEKLFDSNEFSTDFFKIIDEIENDILNNQNIYQISNTYNFNLTELKDLGENNDEEFINEIFNKRDEEKIQIIDKEDYFLIYEIKSIKRKKPDLSDMNIIEDVKNKLSSITKFNYNKEILKKIETNDFNNDDFLAVVKGDKSQILKKTINAQNDNSFFNIDSLKLLYTVPRNDFLLIVDNKKNVYLTKIVNFIYNDIKTGTTDFNQYLVKSNFRLKNYISSSYDNLINNKYKITINYNSLEKIKNFFR